MLEAELTAAKDQAIADMLNANEDEQPLYREAWQKAEDRLSDWGELLEARPGGELGLGCAVQRTAIMLGVSACSL